ncbi:MAG: AI-2E family transporter [Bacteroidales bacterium]|nr:AI-2E family transporter [Bacteroidales bacterium]
MNNTTPYWNIDRIMRLIIGIAIAAVLIMLIRYLSNVLLPFVVACFFAYLLQPLVEFNRRWMHVKGRTLPSVVTLIDILAVLGIFVYIFVPTIISEADHLGEIIKNVTDGRQPVPAYYRSVIIFVERYVSPEQIKATLSSMHIEELVAKGSSLLEESIDVILQTLGWALTLVYLLFILIDYPHIVRGFKLIFPGKYRDRALVVVNDVKQSMQSYFRGQGLVALCAAVFYCIGFSIIRLPLAIPMGILVGILYMIPYFQYVTLIPVAIICFITSLGGQEHFVTLFGKSLLVYLVSQSICDYILTPRIMGKEMGLNPAMILLSLSIWGSLLGIIGMIIALPVTSLILTYYEKYISNPRPKHHTNATATTSDTTVTTATPGATAMPDATMTPGATATASEHKDSETGAKEKQND